MHLSRHAPVGASAGPSVAARRRLAGRLLDSVEDGLMPGTCVSRALESALVLRLYQLEGAVPAATPGRGELVDYLRWVRHTASPDSSERLLAGWALTGPGADTSAAVGELRSFRHFSAGRKRCLAAAVAKVFGARLDLGPVGSDVDRQGLHAWASAYLTAAQVILAPERASEAQVAELRATQRGPGIWEEHILCHVLVLHALRLVPGHEDLVRRGVVRLRRTQREDGGFPFIRGEGIFVTAMAGVGLAGTCGYPRPKVIAMADRLAGLQRPDGGWAYAVGVEQTDVDDTSVVVEFLRAADPYRYRPAVAAGLGYLRRIRGRDGGFPTYVAGADSEVTMTAAAANAIRPSDPRGTEILREAIAFLAEHQRSDGTFEAGWSRSRANAICRAVLAMRAAPRLGEPKTEALAGRFNRRCSRFLLESQNTDGGWGQLPGEASDPISTAFSVIALSHAASGAPGAAALAKGTTYLLREQHGDGGYACRPESVGPRPVLFDVPALADAYVLLGLGHLETAGPVPAVPNQPSPRTKGPLMLPEMYLPFPARRSPLLDEVRTRTRNWARGQGMFEEDGTGEPGLWSVEKFDTQDLALSAAMFAPEASAEELERIACWCFLLTFYDDYFLTLYKNTGDRAGAQRFTDRLAAFLPLDDERNGPAPRPGNPVERGLASLWPTARQGRSAGWQRRFRTNLLNNTGRSMQEVSNNSEQRVPDLMEYMEMRRGTAGAPWVADLVERARGLDLPTELYLSEPVQAMVTAAADHVTLANDLFSHRKESELEEDPHNAVVIVQELLACAAGPAMEVVNDLATSRVGTFQHLAASQEVADLTEEQPELKQYVQGLRDVMAGNLEWTRLTGRYTVTDRSPGQAPVPSGPTGLGTSAARIPYAVTS
ncbi:prenyltransferase/squalene oxidase repeat-containing protein [Streptomyces sp. Amel2xC10]|uniref:terpene synthase family protein n=1 Tax=Streptomyces sp. Amel2xC10 TaxID=1305826 RepID=UPI00117D8AC1|nr:prenyltransferase/squalene oxidase repeat-containing protein [Streptomyces sp. Amel2xC10]